ncbi:MAG TPA: thiamine-phosphate kinase [Thermoplasmata archaeon]|nr:thiamine-phosphate kinase [Thermoplasmata archaeon]
MRGGRGPRREAPPRRFREDAFHRWLERSIPGEADGLLRMGDDVAALRLGAVTLLLTTDALCEGTHFEARSPPRAIGEAAISASLSDLASKGGTPRAALLDLLIPPSTPIRWAQEVVAGAESAARRFDFHVVGGDTKRTPSRSVVGTVLGTAPSGPLPGRDGARPGDVLVATGVVGHGGALGRGLLERRRPTARELARLLEIRPRLAEGRALRPFARAMLDTSDGLADAARRLARASGVRVVVDVDSLRVDPELADVAPPARRWQLALFGGDYELLASVAARDARAAVREVERAGGRARVIGRVVRGRGARLRDGGRLRPMPPAGWDPFGPLSMNATCGYEAQ